MPGGDPPIIITGGSVSLDFDPGTLPSVGKGKHENPNKKIKRVEVTGNGINLAEDTPNGKVTIKVYYGNP